MTWLGRPAIVLKVPLGPTGIGLPARSRPFYPPGTWGNEREVIDGWQFVLTKNAKGQFHWSLKAGNGETIASSETYSSKAAALNGIESVKKNAAGATTDDQTDK